MPAPWQILTGEFPPVPGGVSDYTAQVARGLAAAGREVHVWTTHAAGEPASVTTPAPGVTLHRWASAWSRAGFTALDEQLRPFAGPRRILVQYTPTSWGYRGVNFALGSWLAARRQAGDTVWAMVHEPFYPWRLWDKPTRWLLAALHRQMMRQLLAASERAFVAIPAWEPIIAPFAPRDRRPAFTWLPIPSNVPVVDSPAAVAEVRQRYSAETLLGSFSTYSSYIKAPLQRLVPQLLAAPERGLLLLGRGGAEFARELSAVHPQLAARIHAPGDLPLTEISAHLQALDLLIQPFPDGASTRRTTLMAGLAHGLPIVTNTGSLSEPLWTDTGCVQTVTVGDVLGMAAACETLLASPDERRALGALAQRTYAERFSLERTVERLLAAAAS